MNIKEEYKRGNWANRAIIASTFMSIGWLSFMWGIFQKTENENYSAGVLFLGISIVMFLASSYLFYVNIFENRPRLPKIIGWTKYNENHRTFESSPEDPMLWANAEQAVINEIRRKGYKFGGNYHQYGEFGCPVFEDHRVFMVSMRHWGDIMSRVWGGDYCSFAWEDAIGKVPSKKAVGAMLTKEEIDEREKSREEALRDWKKTHEMASKEIDKNE